MNSLDEIRDIVSKQLVSLLFELEASLGRKADLIPTTSLDQHFLDAIQGEEILLYESHESHLTKKYETIISAEK